MTKCDIQKLTAQAIWNMDKYDVLDGKPIYPENLTEYSPQMRTKRTTRTTRTTSEEDSKSVIK